jgi:DNA-directed RNA polymerase subunit RPC12/RpoP
MKNEHGYCARCGMDFDGEDIVQVFIAQGETPKEALFSAENFYGYEEGRTKFSLKLGIYDMYKDRTVAYRCPTCSYEWDR